MEAPMDIGLVQIAVVAVVLLLPYALYCACWRLRLRGKPPLVLDLGRRLEEALSLESAYLTKGAWRQLKAEADALVAPLKHAPRIVLLSCGGKKAVVRLISILKDDAAREERNRAFKEREVALCADLFVIDGKELDDQQRDAIATDEQSNLVVAGAGSGKTLTIIGKVRYLIERWRVEPSRILVVSFTKKAAGELQERLGKAGIAGVRVSTFHAFGRSLLDGEGVADEGLLKRCIRRFVQTELPGNAAQMKAYLEFLGCYRGACNLDDEEATARQHFERLKGQDLTTIKGRLEAIAEERAKGRSTLKGERVKSDQELMIANFLFLNGVEYEYEKNYAFPTGKGRAYQPDFYLPDYDLWLEHFGIDRNGRVPWMGTAFEEQKYLDGIEWKRALHKQCGTRLIESYAYWNDDNGLLSRLRDLLVENGVELVESQERLEGIFRQIGLSDRFHESMVELISSFVSLYREAGLSVLEVEERARSCYGEHAYLQRRFDLFMEFAVPIIDFYCEDLEERGKIDFSDMVNKAAAAIRSGSLDRGYAYVIVDEYQDASMSRFKLIEAVRDATGAKLLCVGDDWQSIYRFSGSDVTLFTRFESLMGDSEVMRVEQTYRSPQELADVASSFIMRNGNQIGKDVRSARRRSKPIKLLRMNDQVRALQFALDAILSTAGGYEGEILILGRHTFDLKALFPDLRPAAGFSFRKGRDDGDVLITYRSYDRIRFMTVHRAKGLEADDVVVLNLTNRQYGFPNQIVDDPILSLLLSGEDDYPFAEERRLFYVALTRSKNDAWLLSQPETSSVGASVFARELLEDFPDQVQVISDDETEPLRCPKCGVGSLVVRRNGHMSREFLGCTNWPACDKTYRSTEILNERVECPQCGGWMMLRKGKHGEFYGCSNYPDCRGTISIVMDSRFEYGSIGF